MTSIKNIILIFMLTFSFLSCTDNREKRRKIVSEKIEVFSKKETEWNYLTQQILKEPFVNANMGKFINPQSLSKPIAKELKNKGIYRITVNNNSECKEVEYTTNWTEYPIGTLYLTWTTCGNTKQTEKGYYEDNFHDNFIEIWGIGNNWLIWTDSDFI